MYVYTQVYRQYTCATRVLVNGHVHRYTRSSYRYQVQVRIVAMRLASEKILLFRHTTAPHIASVPVRRYPFFAASVDTCSSHALEFYIFNSLHIYVHSSTCASIHTWMFWACTWTACDDTEFQCALAPTNEDTRREC